MSMPDWFPVLGVALLSCILFMTALTLSSYDCILRWSDLRSSYWTGSEAWLRAADSTGRINGATGLTSVDAAFGFMKLLWICG